ncbi:MAG: hypothetical protein GXO43_01595 [Crenarchaeota archaeon]|nr:hypothetical protein [Thermoproteota archaeon]
MTDTRGSYPPIINGDNMVKIPDLPKDVLQQCYDEEYVKKHPEILPTCRLVWHHDSEILRRSIQDELQAQSDYERRADDAINPLVSKALLEIANEEKVHEYEFIELLRQIDKYQKIAQEKAEKEVQEYAGIQPSQF